MTGAPGRQRPAAWRWAGVAVGLVAAYAVTGVDSLGRGLLLAAPVLGLGVLTGTLLGELSGATPAGTIRRAGLHTRRGRDYLPRVLGVAVAASTLLLIVLGAVTTALGSPDDQGRAGRVLACVHGAFGASHGPWPGSFYTVPAGAVVLAGLVLAAVVLRRVVRRPQPAGTAAADDELRRHSAEAVTAAVGILVAVPLAGTALYAAIGFGGLADTCARPGWTVAAWTLGILTVAAFVLATWCAAVLLLPPAGTRRPPAVVGAAPGLPSPAASPRSAGAPGAGEHD